LAHPKILEWRPPKAAGGSAADGGVACAWWRLRPSGGNDTAPRNCSYASQADESTERTLAAGTRISHKIRARHKEQTAHVDSFWEGVHAEDERAEINRHGMSNEARSSPASCLVAQ